jgi:hypothetical protein
MLTSITPLGERGRGQKWGITTIALIAGCTAAAAAVGAIAGLAGSAVLGGASDAVRLSVAGVILAVGLIVDVARGERPLPGLRRQVNEDWLHAYRGWVYGLGFGLQLGLGVATVVTTSMVYASVTLSFVSASLLAGAVIGGAFGLARGWTVLAAWWVRTPADLVRLGGLLTRWEGRSRRWALLAQGALVVLAIAAAAAIA